MYNKTVLHARLQGGCRHMRALSRTPSALRCAGLRTSIAALCNTHVFYWHLHYTQTYLRWPKGVQHYVGLRSVFFLFVCFELHAVMSELHMMSCKHEVSRCQGCWVMLLWRMVLCENTDTDIEFWSLLVCREYQTIFRWQQACSWRSHIKLEISTVFSRVRMCGPLERDPTVHRVVIPQLTRFIKSEKDTLRRGRLAYSKHIVWYASVLWCARIYILFV